MGVRRKRVMALFSLECRGMEQAGGGNARLRWPRLQVVDELFAPTRGECHAQPTAGRLGTCSRGRSHRAGQARRVAVQATTEGRLGCIARVPASRRTGCAGTAREADLRCVPAAGKTDTITNARIGWYFMQPRMHFARFLLFRPSTAAPRMSSSLGERQRETVRAYRLPQRRLLTTTGHMDA